MFTPASMRRTVRIVVLAALAVSARVAGAQFLSVSGNPAPLRVQTATAGSLPLPVADNSTTYTVINFSFQTRKIIAQINQPMPAGVTLTANLAAPGGATSLGPVALTTTPRDVVTGIGFAITSRSIAYQLSATLAAGVVPVQTRTVTLTIVASP